MTQTITNQMEKIKFALKEESRSTSDLAFRTGLNFYVVQARLDDMFSLGLVQKDVSSSGTYWKLKTEGDLAA